jgi:nucleotide-binding universal stress UspA family protein
MAEGPCRVVAATSTLEVDRPIGRRKAGDVPTGVYIALVLAVWLALGLGAALFLGRRGYRSGSWYLVGAALGPLFVPIALERGRRHEEVVERVGPGPGPAVEGVLTVVVGVDGSAESDQVLRDAVALFGARPARFLLVSAIDPDVVEFSDESARTRCRSLLEERAAWLPPDGVEPVLEIVTGEPGHALLRVAGTEGAQVVLVGRRGRGLSHRLLGSVAEYVTHHATVPVVLSTPVRRTAPH